MAPANPRVYLQHLACFHPLVSSALRYLLKLSGACALAAWALNDLAAAVAQTTAGLSEVCVAAEVRSFLL